MSESIVGEPATPAYDWLRETVQARIDRRQALMNRHVTWFVIAEALLVCAYGICLQKLAELSAQEPATYPKENIPVSALAWFTAWALPFLGLALAAAVFLLLTSGLRELTAALAHWHRSEGLAASTGQRLPAELYPPLRAGGWSLLLVPVLFAAFWIAAVRLESPAIEHGIENWRNIPQDQA